MQWDNIRKQFYVEKSDVIANTTITEEDLRAEYGDNIDVGLKENSRKVYNFIDAAYRGVDGYRQALAIRKIIYKSKEKQTALMDAINYYTTKDIYLSIGVAEKMPQEVRQELETLLRSGGLYIKGTIQELLSELEKDWGDMA